MNYVKILLSCAANFGLELEQLDVKNAFLHRKLEEEVYLEIPPGFVNPRIAGKVSSLKKALYGLNSP